MKISCWFRNAMMKKEMEEMDGGANRELLQRIG